MVQHYGDSWPTLAEFVAKHGWNLSPAWKDADILPILLLRHDRLRSYGTYITRGTNHFFYRTKHRSAFADVSELSCCSSTNCIKVGSLRYRAAAQIFASFRQIPTASDLNPQN